MVQFEDLDDIPRVESDLGAVIAHQNTKAGARGPRSVPPLSPNPPLRPPAPPNSQEHPGLPSPGEGGGVIPPKPFFIGKYINNNNTN